MNNILVQDVCEVYLRDIATPTNVYFLGITSKNDITQKVKQDMLRGGIGNGVVGLVQSDKEISFKVTTLLHNDDVYAIQSGTTFSAGVYTVQANENGKLVTGKITINGTPKNNTVAVFDRVGTYFVGTYADGQVSIAGGVEGAYYTVVYPTDLSGKALSLDSKKFPKNYYVELHTIAYDVDLNTVTADIYWQFNKALPDGGMTVNNEAGKNNGDEMGFTAQLLAGSTEYGKYVVIPRSGSGTSLLTPPVLTADSSGNTANSAVDVTFTTNALWEASIYDVTVNGISAGAGNFTVTSGNINILGTKFPTAKTYIITVKATGYSDSVVSQIIS